MTYQDLNRPCQRCPERLYFIKIDSITHIDLSHKFGKCLYIKKLGWLSIRRVGHTIPTIGLLILALNSKKVVYISVLLVIFFCSCDFFRMIA